MSVPHTYLKGHTYPVVIASRITFLAIEHKPYRKVNIYDTYVVFFITLYLHYCFDKLHSLNLDFCKAKLFHLIFKFFKP